MSNIKEIPEEKFPNLRGWYSLVKIFTPEVRGKWGSVQEEEKSDKRKKSKDKEPKQKKEKDEKPKDEKPKDEKPSEEKPKQEKPSEEKPKQEKPKEEKPKEEKSKEAELTADDLFGDEASLAEAEKAVKEKQAAADAEKAEKAEKAEQAKKEKKKEAAKSMVRMEVKVYDSETNLDTLAKRIFEEIQFPSLIWQQKYKKMPFAYGIEKLIISCMFEDEKIETTDDIIEAIVAMDDEELVQSVDILDFNKV